MSGIESGIEIAKGTKKARSFRFGLGTGLDLQRTADGQDEVFSTGAGALIAIEQDDTAVGGGSFGTLDLELDTFTVTENPAQEANIDLGYPFTNGEAVALAVGDVVYVSDAAARTVKKADADDAGFVGRKVPTVLVVTVGGAAAAQVRARDLGIVGGLSGLTVGATYYVSTTAGAITATAPTATGSIVYKVGTAVSMTELAVQPVYLGKN